MLYECVADKVPFNGEIRWILHRILNELPQSPRALGAEIDSSLDALILQCLAKSREDRPRTASALAQSLRRYSAELRDTERTKTVLISGITRAPGGDRTPFVGRAAELQTLQQRLNSAIAGECQFVMVSGESGIGANAFAGRTRSRGHGAWRARPARARESSRGEPSRTTASAR